MKWRIALFLFLGLLYYGYVCSIGERAMTAFETWKYSYLTTIDKAAAGEVPSPPPNVQSVMIVQH
jgi:hypothetical protein